MALYTKPLSTNTRSWADLDLDFIAQSKWTTDYLNLPPENFKLVPWML